MTHDPHYSPDFQGTCQSGVYLLHWMEQSIKAFLTSYDAVLAQRDKGLKSFNASNTQKISCHLFAESP
jgi:hypothetical protein